MVDGQDCERGIDGVCGNRQVFGDSTDHRRGAVAALPNHDLAGFDGDDGVRRFVGTGPGADVRDRSHTL
jgi:hypothetical protein